MALCPSLNQALASFPFHSCRPDLRRSNCSILKNRRHQGGHHAGRLLGAPRRSRRRESHVAAQAPWTQLHEGVEGGGGDDAEEERVGGGEDVEECEVVNGREVALRELSPGEKLEGYLVQPLKNNNGSGVLLLPDEEGHRGQETREFAHRLACFGYSVYVADVYRGQAWDWCRPTFELDAWREAAVGHTERVASDIDEAATFLKSHVVEHAEETAGKGRLALVGFSTGGDLVLDTLARDGQGPTPRYSTAVSFYGTRFNPEALGPSIGVPVLLVGGDQDSACPVEKMTALAEHLPGSQVDVFAGCGHGFAHRPSSMDEDEDAEAAFQDMRRWLHEHLLDIKE